MSWALARDTSCKGWSCSSLGREFVEIYVSVIIKVGVRLLCVHCCAGWGQQTPSPSFSCPFCSHSETCWVPGLHCCPQALLLGTCGPHSMAPSTWKLQVAVAEFGSEKTQSRKCQKHLPAAQLGGTGAGASSPGGQREADTAFCHLPAPCGTGMAMSPWQHRGCSWCQGSQSPPGAVRGVGSPARPGGLGAGEQPLLASPLPAVDWEAPANPSQKGQSWFCCSTRSQPVKDNRKRWSR